MALATGRSPWSGVVELADDLELRGPHVTMQGALISEPASGAVVRLRTLPTALYRDVVAFGDEHGLDPIVALIEGHRAERLPDGIDFIVPHDERLRFAYVTDLARLADERPIRVFLPTGRERHQQVRLAALERFATRGSVIWSDLTGIEVLAPGTNKGEAVAWLAAREGISREEIAAVGDAPNDIDLLRVAGRSAAMSPAPAEVREAADIVVPPSSEDGVLDALAWFFPGLLPDVPLPSRPVGVPLPERAIPA